MNRCSSQRRDGQPCTKARQLGFTSCHLHKKFEKMEWNEDELDYPSHSPSYVYNPNYEESCNLRVRLRELMDEHTYRTYNFVRSWDQYNKGKGSADLSQVANYDAAYNFIIENQKEIGAAFARYYGQANGNKVASLFIEHINKAAPVLHAFKFNGGESKEFKLAYQAWETNADQIGIALVGLFFPFDSIIMKRAKEEQYKKELRTHLNQVTNYAVAWIRGEFSQSTQLLKVAKFHMQQFGDRYLHPQIKTKVS